MSDEMVDKKLENDILERLRDPDEPTRYKALVLLREEGIPPTADLARALARLDTDTSRPVRHLSRDILASWSKPKPKNNGEKDLPAPMSDKSEPYPGSFLPALISWGSALTGLMMTGMSLLNYFMLGYFPFPDALNVLLVVNAILTLPYLVLGVTLLAPGRAQKRLASSYAYLSIIMCAGLIVGLRPAFDRWWAFQFTEANQILFRNFLAPAQLALVFLPLVAGQLMLLYYLGQFLARAKPRTVSNEVDTTDEDG